MSPQFGALTIVQPQVSESSAFLPSGYWVPHVSALLFKSPLNLCYILAHMYCCPLAKHSESKHEGLKKQSLSGPAFGAETLPSFESSLLDSF